VLGTSHAEIDAYLLAWCGRSRPVGYTARNIEVAMLLTRQS
jgi:hypothetical protein